MKILILEGIATSGKTTLMNRLEKYLNKKQLSYYIIKEKETLMPILYNTNKDVSLAYLKKVIKKGLNQKKDILIFERLYFTHIFRTNSKIKDFKEIENLFKESTLLVFLKINQYKIKERVFKTAKERQKGWMIHIRKKGSDKEIVDYYIDQQKKLSNLLKDSSIKHVIYNTSKLNIMDIMRKVIDKMKLS